MIPEQPRRTTADQSSPIEAVTFSLDGRNIATVNGDSLIALTGPNGAVSIDLSKRQWSCGECGYDAPQADRSVIVAYQEGLTHLVTCGRDVHDPELATLVVESRRFLAPLFDGKLQEAATRIEHLEGEILEQARYRDLAEEAVEDQRVELNDLYARLERVEAERDDARGVGLIVEANARVEHHQGLIVRAVTGATTILTVVAATTTIGVGLGLYSDLDGVAAVLGGGAGVAAAVAAACGVAVVWPRLAGSSGLTRAAIDRPITIPTTEDRTEAARRLGHIARGKHLLVRAAIVSIVVAAVAAVAAILI
ncbi:hypothetical protein [Stackebrandtia soli]|uniref:hypothetical protein n=1 Tax=Stackebrandtia soli TaxID=1892856 RepID=UPI0039ED48ED